MSDFDSIVKITDYRKIEEQRDLYEAMFNEEREKRLRIQDQRDSIEKKYSESLGQQSGLNEKEREEYEHRITELESKLKEQTDSLPDIDISNAARNIAISLTSNKEQSDLFERILSKINRQISVPDNNEFNYFFQKDIIHIYWKGGERLIELSTFGQEVKKQYLLMSSKHNNN